MDELTPWEHTVCLDVDMLFLEIIVVDYYFIKHSELYVANKAYTYRGEEVTSDYYRRTFTANELSTYTPYFPKIVN